MSVHLAGDHIFQLFLQLYIVMCLIWGTRGVNGNDVQDTVLDSLPHFLLTLPTGNTNKETNLKDIY